MASLEFLNPVAEVMRTTVAAAPRLELLKGKRIALYSNNKTGGDIALAAIAEELAARHSGLSFRNYVGSAGSSVRLATPEDQEKMSAECDAVIGTTAD